MPACLPQLASRPRSLVPYPRTERAGACLLSLKHTDIQQTTCGRPCLSPSLALSVCLSSGRRGSRSAPLRICSGRRLFEFCFEFLSEFSFFCFCFCSLFAASPSPPQPSPPAARNQRRTVRRTERGSLTFAQLSLDLVLLALPVPFARNTKSQKTSPARPPRGSPLPSQFPERTRR